MIFLLLATTPSLFPIGWSMVCLQGWVFVTLLVIDSNRVVGVLSKISVLPLSFVLTAALLVLSIRFFGGSR